MEQRLILTKSRMLVLAKKKKKKKTIIKVYSGPTSEYDNTFKIRNWKISSAHFSVTNDFLMYFIASRSLLTFYDFTYYLLSQNILKLVSFFVLNSKHTTTAAI